jgi:hypothetical protein
MTRRASTVVTLTAVASFSFAAYQAGRYESLTRGIQQTQNAIQQVDKVLQQDKTDTDGLLQKLVYDCEFGFSSLTGDPIMIAKSANALKTAVATFNATNAAKSGDYWTATQKVAEAIARMWGVLDPRVKFGRALVDVAATAYEAQALLRRQAQLLEVRNSLELQLRRLQRQDPNYETEIEQLLGKLQDDSEAEHQAFLRWLSDHGLSEGDVLKAVLRDEGSTKPVAAGEIARGAVLLDPQSISALRTVPCMNPNFIAALEKGLSRGTLPGGFDAGVTTRHPVAGPYFGPVGPGGSASYYFLSPYSPDTYSTVPMFSDGPCGGGTNAPGNLTFSTGQSETETIYVKNDYGTTGIGLFSQSIDQEDFGSNWALYDSSGTSIVPDLVQPDQGCGRQIIGSASPGFDLMWRNVCDAPPGSYVVKTGVFGMEPFPVNLRSGYVAWVKIPHAAIQVEWDAAFHDDMCKFTRLVIVDSKGQSIIEQPTPGSGVCSDDNRARWVVNGGNYTVALDSLAEYFSTPTGSVMSGRDWSSFPEYHPSSVTAVAGQVTHTKLVLGGYTVSTDSPDNLEWTIVSSDMKRQIFRGIGPVLPLISRYSRSADTKRVHILYPGNYELMWATYMELGTNHKQYRGKCDFTVAESQVTSVIIPAK